MGRFHPPRFSEEEAWLPAWLQPCTMSNEHALEETRENAKNLPDDSTGKSLHLFLSGEDTSVPSCSTNHELQYHLHLSSNQDSLNPTTLSTPQPDQSEFNPEAYMVPSQQNLGPNLNEVVAKCEEEDIRDAIELAVAASEALTIHKVIKDELLIASSVVLEAALRVKQARLENCTEKESNEVDFDSLSDLDCLTLADAYDDVGLSHADHGSISHVNDTFASQTCVSNSKNKCNGSGSSSPKEHNNANISSFALESTNANLACDVDHCSVVFCATDVGLQREGSSIGKDLTSSLREDNMTSLVPDRFQSRWFGGWTCKNETCIPAVPNDKYKRAVPELFDNETSSLSESAPDMGSCVQRQDKDKTVSQSSACAHENENLSTDDVAVSPTDPLCSVVPCSFTSDSVASQNSQRQVNPEGPTVLEVNNGQSSPTVRRQVTSLKTYSMLGCDPYLDTSFEHNQTAQVEDTNQREKVEAMVPKRKRVRFSETEICFPQAKKFQKKRSKDPSVASSICRISKLKPRDKTLFKDLNFLLTGFSIKKHKQLKMLIQKNGGVVFDDIPSPPTSKTKRCPKLPPLILCPKKLLTTKFLYGCAVNAAGILKVTWLFDSVDQGLILPHHKYKVLNTLSFNITGNPAPFIFDDIAIMLHGKPDFCSKMGKVIKHGRGSVFKTFHWLVKSLDSKKVSLGVIVVEDENGISRQLKQCALEQKVPIMPCNWIINSLYAGRLLPSPKLKLPDHLIHVEMSQEI